MTLTHLGQTIRIGIVLDPDTWLGGRSYFRNLLVAVSRLRDARIEPVIFTGKLAGSALEWLPPVTAVRTRMMDRGSPPWFIRKILIRTLAADWTLYKLMSQQRIAVISHGGPLVSNSTIASVGWIPDFQHIHLPNLFSQRERETRDRHFMDLCRRCDKVIVSSECARADLETFAPEHAAKAAVLRFVASPAEDVATPSLSLLRQRYDFEGPYFLLPNQFWAHKNHRVVIRALMLLKQRNKTAVVLATGNTQDHRQPEFFNTLMQYAEECGVLDRFRVLGVVPFPDLAALMLHAIALINPSHFEGWSTSVEESKSLGKTILLSDIPVHREQSPALGVFFAPDDAEDLAQKLWKTLQEFNCESQLTQLQDARMRLPERQMEFAQSYQQILLSARR